MNDEPNSVNVENPDRELRKFLNEGYPSLVKWMITLSTGAIVFSVNLSQNTSSVLWQRELAVGLIFLIISIISGVRYLRVCLDYAGYNLEWILNKRHLNKLKSVSDDISAIKDQSGFVEGSRGRMDKIKKWQTICFNCQQWSFYIGLLLIALFRVCNI